MFFHKFTVPLRGLYKMAPQIIKWLPAFVLKSELSGKVYAKLKRGNFRNVDQKKKKKKME